MLRTKRANMQASRLFCNSGVSRSGRISVMWGVGKKTKPSRIVQKQSVLHSTLRTWIGAAFL